MAGASGVLPVNFRDGRPLRRKKEAAFVWKPAKAKRISFDAAAEASALIPLPEERNPLGPSDGCIFGCAGRRGSSRELGGLRSTKQRLHDIDSHFHSLLVVLDFLREKSNPRDS